LRARFASDFDGADLILLGAVGFAPKSGLDGYFSDKPGQVAPVSHGCPSVLMRGVRILNTAEEGSA